jgi:hypothetical protein
MRIQNYPPEIELQMRSFYTSLSEKDRRRYAAIEVTKLGYGGTAYISELLQCDEKTIRRGQRDLNADLSNETKRVRQNGAGRKQVLSTTPELDDVFLETLKNNTAGSPMDETIKWTNLSRSAIAEKLEEQGFKVSITVVDKLLKKHNFRRRQAFKVEAGKKNIPQRDEQFKNIEELKLQYIAQGNPVLSMDVKKKN